MDNFVKIFRFFLHIILLFISVSETISSHLLKSDDKFQFAILTPPSIVKQPPLRILNFLVAEKGEDEIHSIVLDCEATGEPPPIYKWIKDGEPFQWQANDRIIHQVGKGTIIIFDARDTDAGYYQCIAENKLGVALSNIIHVQKSKLDSFPEEKTSTLAVVAGKPLSLACNPPASIPKSIVFWALLSRENTIRTLNNSRITSDPEGTLHFSSVSREDVYYNQDYACVVTNMFRNEYKVGNKVKLNVIWRSRSGKLHVPVIQYSPPRFITAYRGDTLELHCIFGGSPQPAIQWYKREGGLPETRHAFLNSGKTLQLKNIDFDDKGTYECVASNGVGAPQTRTMSIQIQARPYWILEPTNRNVTQDEDVELECKASGIPEPRIDWFINGIPMNEAPINPRRTIVSPTVIRIKRVQKFDSAVYQCNASSANGYIFKNFYLNVLALEPTIVESPQTQYETMDSFTVILTCRVVGAPKPVVRWSKNGIELTGERYRILDDGNLEIRNVTPADAGHYSCTAANKFGLARSKKDVGQLEVLSMAPTVAEPPAARYQVIEGLPITLTCRIFGAPTPTVMWKRNGKELIGGKFNLHENGNLEIREARFWDAGNYTCVGANKFGIISSSADLGWLKVLGRTRITTMPLDSEVAMGQNAIFHCNGVADENLHLKLEWLKNGQIIDFHRNQRMFKDFNNSLVIISVNEMDSGLYTCFASTRLDNATASAILTVQDIPNPPLILGVHCKGSYATVNWKPQGDNRAPIINFKIQYNTSFTPETWEEYSNKISAIDRAFTIVLSPWANYTFRIIARNKIGDSLPSKHSETCSTLPDVPKKNPDHVVAAGTTSTNLVISWVPMPPIEHNAPGFFYRIYYKVDLPDMEWKQPINITNWEQSEYVVLSEEAFRPYVVKVEAHNEIGQALIPAEKILGFSGEDPPLEAPKNFKLLRVLDGNTAEFTWDPVSPESVRGYFKGYKFQTWTSIEGQSNKRETMILSGFNIARIELFVPNTLNNVRMMVVNGRFDGPSTPVLTFHTPEGVPGPIPKFDGMPRSSNFVYLYWTKPKELNGNLTGYRVTYAEIMGSLILPERKVEPLINPSETYVELKGLQKNTKYRISIAGCTAAGCGEPFFIEVKTKNGQKPIAKPIFMWNVLPIVKGKASVNVIWLPNADGYRGSHFYVEYRKLGDVSYMRSSNEYFSENVLVENLSPASLYEMRLVVVEGEYFTYSDSEEIQTTGVVPSPPSIVKQPPSGFLIYQVAVDPDEKEKPFVLECEATGEPQPTYKWTKNGQPFQWQAYDDRITQQPGLGTLVVTVPSDVDEGYYQCLAENEHGIALSNGVFVRKLEFGSFPNTSLITRTVNEGEAFTLECSPPSSFPKAKIFWILMSQSGLVRVINSPRITGDPDGRLHFSNATIADATDDYVYACAAALTTPSWYKLGNNIKLEVIPSPSSPLIKHAPLSQFVSPPNVVAFKGESVALHCIFAGTPLPEIQWKKINGFLPEGRHAFLDYGKTLQLLNIELGDEGTYECVASNGVGVSQSRSMNVHIQARPYWVAEPYDTTEGEDENVEFECKASGIPEPDIKWFVNGVPLSEAPHNPRRKFVSPSVLRIEELQKSDTAVYQCNASSTLGYVFKNFYVNVLALAPTMVEPPQAKYEIVDSLSITLTCRVFGVPKPVVKWSLNGKELTGGRFSILDNGDLEIRNVIFSDAGNYFCQATNKFGIVESSNDVGWLEVRERTRIIPPNPVDYEVAAGQSVTFRCNAVVDSNLVLSIDWLSNWQLIDFNQDARMFKAADYSLTISKTSELDSGTYTCVASTRLDNATASATLIVQDIPNPPMILGVRCEGLYANINWRPQGDNRAPILNYKIQYNTSFTPDSWEEYSDGVSPYDQTFSVSMSPWANYTFRVIARNKIGDSLPSQHSEQCHTYPDVPYKNPENVVGAGTNPTNLVITWTPMHPIEHNAPEFFYRVYYRRELPNVNWNDYRDIAEWQNSQLEIPNQETFQQYRIKVEAHNKMGQANMAAVEVIGWSGEDTPLEAPKNFTLVRTIDGTTAEFSWEPVSPESVRGHFKGYRILSWTLPETRNQRRETIVSANSSFARVEMFVPFSMNNVHMMVFNGRHEGPPTPVISFQTPEGVPGPVAAFNAE